MDRILRSKKTREDLQSDAKLPAKKPARRWGRKKQEPEAKPNLDVSAALPSSDDFRTSLLMPNLMGRFSMLRDQDNPSSLIGKASDDSVLDSNRRSGLGFGGLGDIAEVSSIKEGTRPPFAPGGRSGSYQAHTDGYGTDDDSSYNGSIMSRARPGEGNMLFGGRQKIYKIPIGDSGAVNNMGSNEPRGMRGRALYEDDVSLSSFQKLRAKERQEERERKLAELEREMDPEAFIKDGMNSPSFLNYDEKRDTTSSTNSGPPSMMSASTAATSVASQGPSSLSSPVSALPPGAHPQGLQASQAAQILQGQTSGGLQRSNSRRLYEQGLDQHISEHQAAAVTRMNSIQRKGSARGRNPSPGLSQSRSTGNLNERYDQGASSSSSRAASPLPSNSEKLTTFQGLKDSSNSSPVLGSSGFPSGETEKSTPLTQALAANDRGKATALGTFNRPRQFDEQQFLARQRSLHQQQSRPRKATRGESPARPAQPRPSVEGRMPSSGRPSFDRQPRSRAGTGRSDRSWSASSSTRNAPIGVAVTSPTAVHSSQHSSPQRSQLSSADGSTHAGADFRPKGGVANSAKLGDADSHSNLQSPSGQFASPKMSFERGTSADLPPPLRQTPPQQSPPRMQDHPAVRAETTPTTTSKEKRNALLPDATVNVIPPENLNATTGQDSPFDSPHRAAQAGVAHAPDHEALGGMVRQHLRQISNVSSVYGSDSGQTEMPDPGDRVPSMYSQQANPWDLTEFASTDREGQSTVAGNGQIPNQSTGPQSPSKSSSKLPLSADPTAQDAAAWMAELRKQHQREASTETQHEREAFSDELAQRQRAIQQNLKVKADSTARSASPAGNKVDHSFNAFGILRQKSSRENLHKQQNQDSKGLKLLGLSSNNQTSAGAQGPEKRSGPPNGPLPAGRNPPGPSMGRTLHSRMPAAQASEESSPRPSREVPRPRNNSQPTDRHTPSMRSTPPGSGRTSTSRDRGPSSSSSSHNGQSRGPSHDIHRREFPSRHPSPTVSGRPSMEHMQQQRLRSHSAATRPAIAPLRTQTAPMRPPGMNQSSPQGDPRMNQSANSTPVNDTSMYAPPPPQPLNSSQSAMNLHAGSRSRGESDTSTPETPSPHQPLASPHNLPPGTYTLPQRPQHQRPAPPSGPKVQQEHRRILGRGRGFLQQPHIAKSDISEPKLISSTREFEDTIELSLAREQMAVATANGVGPIGNISVGPPAGPPPTTPVPPVPTDRPPKRGWRPFARRDRERDDGVASPTPTDTATRSSASSDGVAPPPPLGGSPESRRKGSFTSSGGRSGKAKSHGKEPDSEDEFMARPPGGRLRIRKVSAGDAGSLKGARHEAVAADVVEGPDGREGREGPVVGGMF